VVADVVEHYPGLVESIVEHGHEIACHGLNHVCKIDPITKRPAISRDEFKARTLKSKKMLERIYKNEVIGYRAPNALISGWMIDTLEDIGFRYDSSVSVNSLYNKAGDSLKGVSSAPYYPVKNGLDPGEKRNIVEFPYANLNVGLKLPTSGGPMLRFLGSRVILYGLKQSIKRGHTLFYFHPIDICSEKFPCIGNRRKGYWMIKGDLVEKRIIYVLKSMGKVKKYNLREASMALL
jgi:peptidoglycan/xylan/chitin deacetylase (PgdA/CDA1 family)